MTFYSNLPYVMATYIYKEGLECDHAARLIRNKLDEFFSLVKLEVKQEMGRKYTKTKER